jgi:hypothetical protein
VVLGDTPRDQDLCGVDMPHTAEGDMFARHVLPHLDHGPLLPR